MLDRSPGPVRQLDHVVEPHRFFHQQDDPAEEIGRDLLKPEAEPDADAAAEKGERGQVDVKGVQRDEENHDGAQDLNHLDDQLAITGIEAVDPSQPVLERAGDRRRYHENHGDDKDDLEHTVGREHEAVDLECESGGAKNGPDVRQIAEMLGYH